MWNRVLLIMLSLLSSKILTMSKHNLVALTTGRLVTRYLLLAVVAVVGLIVFSAGLGLMLVDVYDTYLQGQQLGLSRLSYVSVPMMAVPTAVFTAWALSYWFAARRYKAAASASSLGPIIEKVVTMIHEYAAEKNVERYHATNEQVVRTTTDAPEKRARPDLQNVI